MAKGKSHSTDHAVAEAVHHFLGREEPVFNQKVGAWKVGRLYYRLWQNRYGLRAITYAETHDVNAQQYLVKGWINGEAVPHDDTETAIRDHAYGRRSLIITNGILRKTRNHSERHDRYHGRHQYYQVDFDGHDVTRVAKGVWKDLRGNLFAPEVMWDKANPPGDGPTTMSRKDAELMVSKDYVATLRGALSTRWHIDPGLQKRHPVHFRFAQAKRLMERASAKMLERLEKLDTGYTLLDNLIGVAGALLTPLTHTALLGWKVAAALIESRTLFKPGVDEKLPGCLNPKDPAVQVLSDDAAFAYPLGGYVRPLKKGIFTASDCLRQPVFGASSLLKHINSISSFQDDGMNGFSEAPMELDIGSTVRIYGEGDEIDALKMYHASGFTVTLFKNMERVWSSFEAERCFDDASILPDCVAKQLKSGHITEITRSEKGVNMRIFTVDDADIEFRRAVGDNFRTPHYPTTIAVHGTVADLPAKTIEAAL